MELGSGRDLGVVGAASSCCRLSLVNLFFLLFCFLNFQFTATFFCVLSDFLYLFVVVAYFLHMFGYPI